MDHGYEASGGSTPFKVTLVWTDYPSTEAATANLVNDLDLTVTNGATTYRGNDFWRGWSQTDGAADRVNNVENVYVQSPVTGDYTVTICGYIIPNGPQTYALVVDGVAATGGGGDASPTVSVTAPGEGEFVTGDSVALAANASDDGAVMSDEFFVDGGSAITGTNAGGGVWTALWDSRGVTDGTSVSIRADATDDNALSPQTTPSATINVMTDNTAPTGVAVQALPESVSSTQPVTAMAEDGSGSGVAQVEFFAGVESIGIDGSSEGGWSIDWDTTDVENGAYSVTAIATDGVGLTSGISAAVAVTVNNSVAAGASASLIAYGRHGGRNGNKHLDVTVSVVDSLGDPVEGASVSITITVDGGGSSASGSGVTLANGDVIFTWHNAPGPETCFATTLDALSASGLLWDEDKSPAGNAACL